MYILNVSYIEQPAKVEPHVGPHSAWVKRHFAEGLFLFAGPKKSGLGGVILAKSIDRPTLDSILAEDPYITESVAEYQILEFDCKAAEPSLALLTTS
ncbi:hypothetical protein CCAX7_12680 [Capsulimonas corticalis]|uniref:Uncharacterized protein n=1 Tax=Capsulimonas corticalis TaxID=2219043 RepID=A0A402D4G0_9BACT|nr:YciI family protein [Capsulimonas corticalis]BDI29217.1 hypothetical protein CCAX7_12680 [Capsulimonas corticalis]